MDIRGSNQTSVTLTRQVKSGCVVEQYDPTQAKPARVRVDAPSIAFAVGFHRPWNDATMCCFSWTAVEVWTSAQFFYARLFFVFCVFVFIWGLCCLIILFIAALRCTVQSQLCDAFLCSEEAEGLAKRLKLRFYRASVKEDLNVNEGEQPNRCEFNWKYFRTSKEKEKNGR